VRRLTDDRGNVVIITALIMTTLFGFLALVIDVGSGLVRKSNLQTGADAAALAIAKGCADAVVTGSTTCTTSIAQGYFDDNLLGGGSVLVDSPILQTSYGGKVGRITVSGATTEQSYFAPLLGFSGTQTVRASATARWGPLTAEDAVFPIAVCKGALPSVDQSVTLVIDPATTADPNLCDGSPDEPPFGWLPPDNTAECAAKITLLPSTYLNVGPVDTPPSGTECSARLDELVNDILVTTYTHCTWWRGCHTHSTSSPPEDRRRVLVVYDATVTGNPSYSLVALEFTGMRLAGREAHRGSTEACPAGQYCIRGVVRLADTPTDGPIVDPALAALPGIEDSTVLDVRLVD
jgi:Flp pilus assembly protein TadG